jgi:hypothetical protein
LPDFRAKTRNVIPQCNEGILSQIQDLFVFSEKIARAYAEALAQVYGMTQIL